MTVVPATQVTCLVTAPNPVTAQAWENALHAEGIQSQLVGDTFEVVNGDGSEIQPEIWIMRQDVISETHTSAMCRLRDKGNQRAEASP